MKVITLIFALTSQLCTLGMAWAQSPPTHLIHQKWNAFWISVPQTSKHDFGVYKFRKVIEVGDQPEHFIVHLSGDNRYKFFVNNDMVCIGPARGDLYHWNYETIDIARYLRPGKNVLGALVWNFGSYQPEAQISFQTGFILQGNSAAEEIANTNKSWTSIQDTSWTPLEPELIYTYYVSGPGERIDFNTHVVGWRSPDYQGNGWISAHEIQHGLPKGVFDWTDGWMLVPRKIPAMEMTPLRLASTRKATGIRVPKEFPATKTPIVIPASTKATLWLDQGYLTNAYPVLQWSKGKDAKLSLKYAEALYLQETTPDWKTHRSKGNRNEVEGKRFVGVRDEMISNGKENQSFTSLCYRTYRYVELQIETKEEPLTIHDIYGLFTAYPFARTASFESNTPELSRILDVGWRTARLCAMETYMDCPYYEQLQYIGDTRIQSLVSMYNSNDDRLVRNAIEQLDHSRIAEGITLSRFPTAHDQQIPTFSLWWIGMLHDYWRSRPDEAFVKDKLPGTRQVLQFFMNYQQEDGSLYNAPYWEFTDWAEAPGWYRGVAPRHNGVSASLDIQLCWAFQIAAQLEAALGSKEYASTYEAKANQLKETIVNKYWNEERQLFSDTEEKKYYSQHVNSLAILADVVKDEKSGTLAEKILSDTKLTPATIYFKYYVHQAAAKAGLGDRYLDWLGDWRNQLAQGLTTWAEISDWNNARSDCHAWGASPNIEFFRITLGIDSGSPGFRKVVIAPHLGKLTSAKGTIAHPEGTLSASYALTKGKWSIQIVIPPKTEAELRWKGKTFPLKEGNNQLTL